MKRNAKPTALVTGAARGIGRGIAARLLAAGWNVALADVLEKEGRQTAAGLNRKQKKNAGRAEFFLCDVADEATGRRGRRAHGRTIWPARRAGE